jgi:hypothetical protein
MKTETRQIARDVVKRRFIDVAQRVGRLQTPMTQLVDTLRAYDALPSQVRALELFGMHGMWHTRDYVNLCASVEVYELNATYAAYAARTLPNSDVVIADSVKAVQRGTLKRAKYDFVVADNPISAPFGDGYAEHFDLFPHVLERIDSGALVLNFIPSGAEFTDEHARRREAFYGKVRPSVDEAAAVYKKRASEAGLRISKYFYTPRNRTLGYLTLICER